MFRYTLYDRCAVITECLTDARSVVIPSEFMGVPVVKLGDGVFRDNTGLRSVVIGRNLLCIGDRAFCGCTELEAVYMSPSVSEIGREAFRNCVSLTGFLFPAAVEYIAPSVLCGCSSLKKVIIESGTDEYSEKEIASGAFADCGSLTSVWMPACVCSVSGDAFGKNTRPVIFGEERTEAAAYAAAHLMDFTVTTREGFDAAARRYAPEVSQVSGPGIGDSVLCGKNFRVTLDSVRFFSALGGHAAGDGDVFAVFIFSVTNVRPVSRYFDGFDVRCRSYGYDAAKNLHGYYKTPLFISTDILGYRFPVGTVDAESTVTGAVVVRADRNFIAVSVGFGDGEAFVITQKKGG